MHWFWRWLGAVMAGYVAFVLELMPFALEVNAGEGLVLVGTIGLTCIPAILVSALVFWLLNRFTRQFWLAAGPGMLIGASVFGFQNAIVAARSNAAYGMAEVIVGGGLLMCALPCLLSIAAFNALGRRPDPSPGHCRCGYDLTGNTSGVCPECGEEAMSGRF